MPRCPKCKAEIESLNEYDRAEMRYRFYLLEITAPPSDMPLT